MGRGDLVIAGGEMGSWAEDILGELLRRAGGGASRVGILASASEDPALAFSRAKELFIRAGLAPERIEELPCSALLPGGARGAWKPELLRRAAGLDLLWMSGGDQARLFADLHDETGPSPLLLALRRALDPESDGRPLVVGGTSAGAAVMSDPMILGGTSFGALAFEPEVNPVGRPATEGPDEAEDADPRRLRLGPGFGFFRPGIVDQHFDARGRLARLVMAALGESRPRPAFGIAEATALVWDAAAGSIGVRGRGGVLVLEGGDARLGGGPGRREVRGLRLHHLTEGDNFRPGDGEPDFGDKERLEPPSRTEPGRDLPFPVASGPLSPGLGLADFVAHSLLEAAPGSLKTEGGRSYAEAFLMEEAKGERLCWELRLFRGPESRLALGAAREERLPDRWSWSGVGLDILALPPMPRRRD